MSARKLEIEWTEDNEMSIEPENTRHHCEMCGVELDNGHEHGPIGDYSYLCQPCERKLMEADPDRFPLLAKPE